jgi:chloramphenicol 3-O phosphotransferase
LTFGVDTFIDALPGRGEHAAAGITYHRDGSITFTEEHRRLERCWYAGLRAMAAAGAPLILDEVLLSGGAGQERLRSLFGDEGVVWVGVHCDREVVAAREADRPDRIPGMARRQALSVHDGVHYDVAVDTTDRSPEACAADIARFLGAVPASWERIEDPGRRLPPVQ